MAQEPPIKRAVAFIDGQNLYRHAKDAFGHHHPNYDPNKLFNAICALRDWTNHGVRFYTGVPSAAKSQMWHGYWANRLLAMRRASIHVTTRPIRYHVTEIPLPGGTIHVIDTPQEKGIDLRLGLDAVRMARTGQLDVAVIFSQDQDLAEVATEIKDISKSQNKWIKVACAFPVGPNATSPRGIAGAEWVELDRATYDGCLDPRDYRPAKPKL